MEWRSSAPRGTRHELEATGGERYPARWAWTADHRRNLLELGHDHPSDREGCLGGIRSSLQRRRADADLTARESALRGNVERDDRDVILRVVAGTDPEHELIDGIGECFSGE